MIGINWKYRQYRYPSPRKGHSIFIDTEDNPLAFGYGPDIAREAQGIYGLWSALIWKESC